MTREIFITCLKAQHYILHQVLSEAKKSQVNKDFLKHLEDKITECRTAITFVNDMSFYNIIEEGMAWDIMIPPELN